MNDPANKDDIESAKQALLSRIDEMEKRDEVRHEGWRQQQSAEHGALQHTQTTILATVRWIQDWCRKMFTNDKH